MGEGPDELGARNVTWVAGAHLCCSCGACQVACPSEAVGFQETPGGYCFPEVDEGLCTGCGLCLRCCPSVTLDERLLGAFSGDLLAGNVLGCWAGKATDEAVYRGSQSGGAASAISLALLEGGRVAGVSVVSMKSGSPPRAIARIARDREGVLAAQGSKYCPVPTLSVLRALPDDAAPLAFVGLPCQVHGLRNLLGVFPKLRTKISLMIGLVCDRVLSCAAIDYLLWRAGLRADQVAGFQYRSKEWKGYPGDVRVKAAGRTPVFLPKSERIALKHHLTPARCRLCFDKMNVFADLTVGDPHGLRAVDRKHGESLVVARTPAGREAVELAQEVGALRLTEASYTDALQGQDLEKKKTEWASYCAAWRELSRPLPPWYRALGVSTPSGKSAAFSRVLRRAVALDGYGSRRALVKAVRRRVAWARGVRRIARLFGR